MSNELTGWQIAIALRNYRTSLTLFQLHCAPSLGIPLYSPAKVHPRSVTDPLDLRINPGEISH